MDEKKPILVLYATREGHTRHIAEHLGTSLSAHQRTFDLIDAAHLPKDFSLANYSAAILAASLHMQKYEGEMIQFVKQHLTDLQRIYTVFLSVSLAERTVEDPAASAAHRAEAEAGLQRTIQNFLSETGWSPSHIAAAAGALPYSKYGFVTRFIMKRISKAEGGPVDTSRDYEFTDWAKLDHLIEQLVNGVQPPAAGS